MDAYDLLPPPARSVLSRYPEGIRGHLPDFTLAPDPAEALRQWTRSLYYINLDRVWVHVYITTGLLSALFASIFIYTCIFIPRLLNGTFWLLRVVRRPAGVLQVPNSMMGFTCFTTGFGILLLAWEYMMHRWFVLKQGSPDLFWLFTLCIWTPLFSASLSATWGLFHSLPNTYSSAIDANSEAGVLRRVLSKPITLNLFGLGLPVVQAASIVVPAALCHVQYIRSLNLYHAWRIKYASQAELSTEMLVEAQQCWYALFPVFRIVMITFMLWFAWAMLEFVTYTFLSLRLARVLGGQLALLRKKSNGNEVTTMSLVVPKLGNPFKYRYANDNTPDGMDAPGATESFFPPVRATHIVRRQAPRTQAASQTERKITHLTTVLYHVIVQLFGIAPTTMTFGLISLWLGIKLYGDIESPRVVWNETAVTGITAVSYTAVIAGVIVLFSIAKRGQRSYEPVLHFRGYGGSDEAKPVRKGPVGRITGIALAGITRSEGSSGASGRGATLTSFFESESIARPPAATFALASNRHGRRGSYHEMKDLERADQPSPDPSRSHSRRFSQTIIITEDPDEGLVDLMEHGGKSKLSDDSRLKPDTIPSTASLRFLSEHSSTVVTSHESFKSGSRQAAA